MEYHTKYIDYFFFSCCCYFIIKKSIFWKQCWSIWREWCCVVLCGEDDFTISACTSDYHIATFLHVQMFLVFVVVAIEYRPTLFVYWGKTILDRYRKHHVYKYQNILLNGCPWKLKPVKIKIFRRKSLKLMLYSTYTFIEMRIISTCLLK